MKLKPFIINTSLFLFLVFFFLSSPLLLLLFQKLKEDNKNDLTFLAMIITSLAKCVSLKPKERRKSAEATLLKMQEPGLIC